MSRSVRRRILPAAGLGLAMLPACGDLEVAGSPRLALTADELGAELELAGVSIEAERASPGQLEHMSRWIGTRTLEVDGEPVLLRDHMMARVSELDGVEGLSVAERGAWLAEIVDETLDLPLASGERLGDVYPRSLAYVEHVEHDEQLEHGPTGTTEFAAELPEPSPICTPADPDCQCTPPLCPIPDPPPGEDISKHWSVEAKFWTVLAVWHGWVKTRSWKRTTTEERAYYPVNSMFIRFSDGVVNNCSPAGETTSEPTKEERHTSWMEHSSTIVFGFLSMTYRASVIPYDMRGIRIIDTSCLPWDTKHHSGQFVPLDQPLFGQFYGGGLNPSP